MHTSHIEMFFQIWSSVGQMCNTFLTSIAKTVLYQPSCCTFFQPYFSRSGCWQQSCSMFGLIPLHPCFYPSHVSTHSPGLSWQRLWGSLKWAGKKMTTVTLKWVHTYWNDKAMQTMRTRGKLGHGNHLSEEPGLSIYFWNMWLDFIKNTSYSLHHYGNTSVWPTTLTI